MPELMTRLFINSVDVTNYAEGLDDVTVNFVLNKSNRTVSYAASATITLRGKGYDLVLPLMLDWSQEYQAQLYVADLEPLAMTVNGRNLTDCGCQAELALQTNTDNRIAYEAIARTILSDGSFWPQVAAAGAVHRVPYCYETNFVSYLILVFYVLFRPMIGFFQAVISLVSDVDLDTIGNFAIGCSRYHYAVNLNKAIKYRTDLASIGWASTILQTNLPDLALLEAYGYEGRLRHKSPKPSYDDNYLINYTVPQILDVLKDVFNADYRIIDGTLHFHRKDWFPANAWQIHFDEIEEYCVELDEELLYNTLRFDYSGDALDEGSQQVARRYNGRVDLNPGEWPTLRESKNVAPKIAMSRFVSDGYGDQFIRKFRKSPWVGSAIEHDLVLAKGQTYELRLLDVIPTAAPYTYIKRRKVGGDYMYQDQLSFKGVPTQFTTLYSEYWDIDNPNKYRRFTIREITIRPKDVCQVINKIQEKSMNVFVQTPYGRAIPEEIEYQTESGIFVLKNCTVWPLT